MCNDREPPETECMKWFASSAARQGVGCGVDAGVRAVVGISAEHPLWWSAHHVRKVEERVGPRPTAAARFRRVLTEWLQGEASETGLVAAATSGAGAIVEAAAASAQLEVSDTAASMLVTPLPWF